MGPWIFYFNVLYVKSVYSIIYDDAIFKQFYLKLYIIEIKDANNIVNFEYNYILLLFI